MLKFLIAKRSEGYYQQTPTPTTDDFYREFYKNEKTQDEKCKAEHPESTGRQVLRDLKDALKAYYRGPGMHDSVFIEVPAGKRGAPQPIIFWNPNRQNDSVPRERELANASSQVTTSGRESNLEESPLALMNQDLALDLDGTAKPARILSKGEWSDSDIEDLLLAFAEGLKNRSIGAGHIPSGDNEIRIWTTFMRFPGSVDVLLYKLVNKGAKVKILILNSENDGLVRGKYRLREEPLQPEKAKKKLKDQIAKIREIAEKMKQNRAKGSLDISACDSIPFGVFYQIGNRLMCIGYALPLQAWTNGPLVKIYPGTRQWEILKKNWEICWDNPLDGVESGR
jgi:hypothetical protein